MDEKPQEAWRARAAVAEALDVFNSPYMQDVWAKALARRDTDPEGAVTSARTLLESVCKHILDAADAEYRDTLPLPQLYELTAKVLEIAPSDKLAPIFKTIFTACTEVIKGVGSLRNELSDSHGRGPFGAMPDWRHAELAVNLSGAMATYLAAVWKGRQPTVSNVIHSYLDAHPDLEYATRTTLEKLARAMTELVAAKLRASDLVLYFEERSAVKQVKPQTIRKEFGLLRVALGGLSAGAVAETEEILRKKNLLSTGWVPAQKRVTQKDVDTLLDYFRSERVTERRHHGTTAAMVDVIEFAIWSGLQPASLLRLRWGDVDFEKRTCKLPNRKHPFPVLERAWGIIEERRSNLHKPNDRIFPYERRPISVRQMSAVNTLMKEGKLQTRIRFHDYRYEAVYRLLEKGHPPHVVAQATGQQPSLVLKIANELDQGGR